MRYINLRYKGIAKQLRHTVFKDLSKAQIIEKIKVNYEAQQIKLHLTRAPQDEKRREQPRIYKVC